MNKGATALKLAIQRGHNHLVTCLISHGANLDAFSHQDENALAIALETQTNQALQRLLTNHANHRRLKHTAETIFHHAAIFVDMGCLRTLLPFGLESSIGCHAGITVYSACADNETIGGWKALKIAPQREDDTPGWREIFVKLMNKTGYI